jgi:hypothetical protein
MTPDELTGVTTSVACRQRTGLTPCVGKLTYARKIDSLSWLPSV